MHILFFSSKKQDVIASVARDRHCKETYIKSVGGFFSENKVYLNSGYATSSTQYRAMTMVHEAAHLSRFMGDSYIRKGKNPLFNSRKAWGNADTYACTVYPAKCGY